MKFFVSWQSQSVPSRQWRACLELIILLLIPSYFALNAWLNFVFGLRQCPVCCASCHLSTLQLHHPHIPWAAEHLLDMERETKVVLVSASGLELKGGLYRVRQMRSFKGQLRQGDETLL